MIILLIVILILIVVSIFKKPTYKIKKIYWTSDTQCHYAVYKVKIFSKLVIVFDTKAEAEYYVKTQTRPIIHINPKQL